MRKRKIYIIMLLIAVLISPVIGSGSSDQSIKITYRIFVDQYHGFSHRVYEVYNMTSGKVIPYNGTLNINKGDTVVWISDTVPDKRLTIISQQELWNNNSADLTLINKQFNYIFNNSGIYDVYIKQYPKFKQKIIVGPIESNISASKTIKINNVSGSNSTNSIVLKSNLSKESSNKENDRMKYLIILPISIITIYIFNKMTNKWQK